MIRSSLIAFGILAASSVFAADKPVEIRFAAQVGDQPFVCGKPYTGIGTTGSTITASDFRLYVSEVALLKSDGTPVPLTLTQDKKWQYRDVALLDFEGKNDACKSGTTDTNGRVVGTVPEGSYTGVAFTLGVPFDLNHADATIADSPLNLSGLFWSRLATSSCASTWTPPAPRAAWPMAAARTAALSCIWARPPASPRARWR